MIKIHLDVAPLSTNQLYRHAGKKVYCTQKYKEWQEQTETQLKQSYGEQAPVTYPVNVNVAFRVNNWRKNDIDNMLKSLFDSMNGVVWVDDAQVYKVSASKCIDITQPPCIDIEITMTVPLLSAIKIISVPEQSK